MQLTAQILLDTTTEQADALKRTLRLTNACCDYMSKLAFERKVYSRFGLQKIAYREVRDAFRPLAAQVVIRAFAKVAYAYALDQKILRTFKPLGAISYDARILSFKPVDKTVSIWSVGGRLKIPFKCGQRQLELLQGKRGEADLCLVKGRFYLFVACEVETPKLIDVDGALGVDLGIVSLATDSDGQSYSGQAIEANRRTFAHRRRNLQRNGSMSAKRKLKKISGKQSRFQKNENHRISKQLVSKAQDTYRAIALEALGGIRDRVTVRRRQRARHANWSFSDLRIKIEYKALRSGVPVVLVDPRNTSRQCSVCGYTDKANRLSQSKFLCRSCGHAEPADTNAAWNTRTWRWCRCKRQGSRHAANGSGSILEPGTSHAALAAVVHDSGRSVTAYLRPAIDEAALRSSHTLEGSYDPILWRPAPVLALAKTVRA